MKSTSRTRSHGFTLIELAIVLVIIGLVVGGVMAGREMIQAANMRKDMSTIERITAATNTFKLKYNYLPGDLPNATNFGFDAVSSGNGDGKIQLLASGASSGTVTSVSSTYPAEWFRVFHHLGKSGMFDFNGNYNTSASTTIVAGTYYPLQATQAQGQTADSSFGYKPGIILAYEKNDRVAGHFFRLGTTPYGWAVTSYITFFGGFTPSQAKIFDAKFDDGLPVKGIIQIAPSGDNIYSDDVYHSGGHGSITTAGAYWRCALLSTEDYDRSYTARSCALRIKAQF